MSGTGGRIGAMDLYARVNILNGQAVRLRRGLVSDAMTLDEDPINRVRGWVEQGADHILAVDLDAAAFGSYQNRPIIDRMLEEVPVRTVVAGGVRSDKEADRLIKQGAWRVMMGTAAIERDNMVWDLCRDHPGKIMVSLDVLENEELVTRGWTLNSGRFMEEVMLSMASCGVTAFFVTDARRDVLSEAPNTDILRAAMEYVDEPIIAAGGTRHLEDVALLRSIKVNGRALAGLVVGREVTEGRFTIEQALAALREPAEPTAPALAQMRVVLQCRDLRRSAVFYEELLGFRELETWKGGLLLEAVDGSLVELTATSGGGAGGASLSLLTDNLDAWAERVKNSKTPLTWENVDSGRRLIIEDPDARPVILAEGKSDFHTPTGHLARPYRTFTP